MRIKRLLPILAFGLFALPMGAGCDSGTSVELEKAPPVQTPPPQPLPKDAKKGGGSGSSGNMNFNPGASS